MRVRSQAKQVLRSLGLRRRRPPWVVAEEQPSEPRPLGSFALHAIVVTWMEADVIEATVRNAFTQGCGRVLLVDNDSPDDTVAVACAAGAELVKSFATAQLDEVLKIRLLNETVTEVSLASDHDHIWWLWLDADEFVHGPTGLTVRQLVASLDQRFRIVGTRYFNHFPEGRPENLPGLHPLDFQPACEERPGDLCSLAHRKHHLQRWDRAGPPIMSGLGFHAASADGTLVEPTTATFTHHFPYRLEAVTRRRFDALCGRGAGGRARVDPYDRQVRRNAGTDSDMSKRYRTVDHVYGREWSKVESLRRSGAVLGVEPRSWYDLVNPADAAFERWYPPGVVETARADWQLVAEGAP